MGQLLDKIFEAINGKGSSAKSTDGAQPLMAKGDEQKPGRLLAQSEQEGVDNPYGDYQTIRERIKKHVEDVSKARWQFERLWFRCCLYYVGNQWVKWDETRREYRQRNLKRRWVPKPVTNRFASTIDAIRGALQTAQVQPSAWPSTESVEDIAATDVAESIIPIIDEEIMVERLKQQIAAWIVLCADSFAFSYYDHSDDSLGRTNIPSERCMLCQHVDQPYEFEQVQQCPNCGGPLLTEPALDPNTQQPIQQDYPIGRLRVDILSPLETYIALDAKEFRDIRKFTRLKTYALSTVKQRYPNAAQDLAATHSSQTKQAQHYLELLTYMTQDTLMSSGRSHTENIGVFTHIEMPSDDYPEGLCAVMADDDTMLEVGPSPFYDNKMGEKAHYLPLVQFGYMTVPGRIYHKCAAYDLLSKQDQRNRLESLMEVSVLKGVYNTWLLPTGSNITRITGEPSQHIRWSPTGTGGAKPECITTAPFTEAVMKWLEKLDSDFEEIGGTYDAVKGAVPPGVSAGYAIQLLTERAYGRFGPVYSNWEFSWTQLYRILLIQFRANVTEPRIQKIKGDTGAWEIKKFLGADLKGSVDIRIEGGSARPRTKIAEQALIETLAKLGVVNPAEPQQSHNIAELFGMSHILGSASDDYREAGREWDAYSTRMQAPTVLPLVDNHLIHIVDHVKRAKTDTYREMAQSNPEFAKFWLQHIADHNMIIMQQQMAQQPQKGKPSSGGQGGSGGTTKGGDSKPGTSKGNENPDKTSDSVRQGGNNTMGAGGKNQY